MPAPGTPGDPTFIAEGEKISNNGILDQKVLACQACRGANGQGMVLIPRLTDQPKNIASDARANDVVHRNAQNLTPEEIDQLAAYVGSL